MAYGHVCRSESLPSHGPFLKVTRLRAVGRVGSSGMFGLKWRLLLIDMLRLWRCGWKWADANKENAVRESDG